MAHIEPPRRRKDGCWWTRVCYRVGGRESPLLRQPICGYATEKECLEAATHWANDFERSKYLDQLSPTEAGATMTCGEVVQSYLEHHVDDELAENSQDYYRRALPIYFTPFWGDMFLSEATPLAGRRWRKWLIKAVAERLAEEAASGTVAGASTGVSMDGGDDGSLGAGRSVSANLRDSPKRSADAEAIAGMATITKMIALGRGVFSFAKDMDWRPDNPLETLKPPKQKKRSAKATRRRKWAPQAVHVEAIRSVISQKRLGTEHEWVIARDRLLVSMMGYEACRQQDLYGSRWWQYIDHDGNVRRRFIIGDGKTRAAEREVKLWRQVREEVAAYYELMGQPDLDELTYPGIRGAQMTRNNWQRDVWKPALADVRKLPGFKDLPHFGPHRLRASAATMLGYALTPQHVALDFLGHEQWTTTAKFYLVAFEDSEGLEGVPVEEQIELAREAPAKGLHPICTDQSGIASVLSV